ncbi:unnamed protein product, partial [Oppiella nova]
IIHRDLKPENILIAEIVRNGRFVKLCDFGLATVYDKRVHYRTTQKHTAHVGDLKYMAPEVLQAKEYSIKGDVYSLALIGSELFGVNLNKKNLYDWDIEGQYKLNDLNEYEISNATKESNNLLRVQSEHVVQYYSSWREGNCIYIQMELCLQSLRNIIEIKPQVFGRQLGHPMDCVEYFISCEIFRQILESVQYLHELNPQIIHRDLKPQNILITSSVRNGRFIKLCDFGLATVHDKRIHNRTTQKHTKEVGDVHYMAPEVIHGRKYDHKSDIYSLSLIGGELFDVDISLIETDK